MSVHTSSHRVQYEKYVEVKQNWNIYIYIYTDIKIYNILYVCTYIYIYILCIYCNVSSAVTGKLGPCSWNPVRSELPGGLLANHRSGSDGHVRNDRP